LIRSDGALRAAVAAVVLVLTLSRSALAGDGGPPAGGAADKPTAPVDEVARKEAASRFNLGTELYAEGNYEGALIEFKKAYEITGEYRVLYNVGQVCFQLLDYVCALTSFDSYLTRGGVDVPEKRRLQIQVDMDRLRARIGTVEVVTSVPDALVTIDDVPRGTTPLAPIALSAGRHSVLASREGRRSATRSIVVAGADAQTIHLDLPDATPPPLSAPLPVVLTPTPPPVERSAPPSRWTALSFVGVATAGAVAIGAGVTGALALSASNDLEKQTYVGSPSAAARSEQSRVDTLRVTSDVMSGAAALTLAATLVFTLVLPPRGATLPPVSLALSPTGFAVHGAF
jgi:PEGA domain